MSGAGILYLFPSSLGTAPTENVLPVNNLQLLDKVDVFAVERPKTARAALKQMGFERSFDDLEMRILDKRSSEDEVLEFLMDLINGRNVGVLSEAGAPGVADPGSKLVQLAHENRITVKPLVGPSSFTLALMASGLNGQGFTFHGYLPIHQKEREKKIKEIERLARQNQHTQVFMETPYRNLQLFQSLLKACLPSTRLCIACDLTTQQEWIYTASIKDWKKVKPKIQKRPAVFLLQ